MLFCSVKSTESHQKNKDFPLLPTPVIPGKDEENVQNRRTFLTKAKPKNSINARQRRFRPVSQEEKKSIRLIDVRDRSVGLGVLHAKGWGSKSSPLPSILSQWTPKYGCSGTVTACFALIARVAWKCCFDSSWRKPYVHPKYGWNGTVSKVLPLIALTALGAFFHSTLGAAH